MMTQLSDLFTVTTAKSKSIDDYSAGNVPFISNGFYNNGIVGHVEPFGEDRVFSDLAICVSAFCEATVQKPPFIGRGNGGSGMTILIPKDKNLTYDELVGYAALINTNIKWRYSYGRMVTKGRISNEVVIDFGFQDPCTINSLLKRLPSKKRKKEVELKNKLQKVPITTLFDLQHGDFHSLAAIDKGEYPTVSRIESNNGIVGYYDKIDEAQLYPNKTISVSTVTGDSFVQLDKFISTDNVVLLSPRRDFLTTTLFFISVMINKEKWRWMYGRQCYKSKFSTTKIWLPINSKGEIDEQNIAEIVENQWGWNMINKYIEQ